MRAGNGGAGGGADVITATEPIRPRARVPGVRRSRDTRPDGRG